MKRIRPLTEQEDGSNQVPLGLIFRDINRLLGDRRFECAAELLLVARRRLMRGEHHAGNTVDIAYLILSRLEARFMKLVDY